MGMSGTTSKLVVFAVVTLVVALLALTAGARTKKPRRAEPVGNFSILTWEQTYLAGWNEGPVRRATTERHTIDYRGRKFRFTGKAGNFSDSIAEYDEFNTVITFPASEPVVVVNVGSPANRSFFYLLRESDGRATTAYLGEASGNPDVIALDGGDTKRLGPHRFHLEGSRLVLLGDRTVLDTTTLETFHVAEASPASFARHIQPVAMSPDRMSFVRLGELDREPVLIVFDFRATRAESLPVDRATMRFTSLETIDAAWIDHHFEWVRRDDAPHDRLQQRSSFVPLPHRGRMAFDHGDGYREYRIQPVRQELQRVFLELLVARLGAEILPRQEYSSADSLRVGGVTVNVRAHDDHLGVWADHGTDSSIVLDIARLADEVLATGAWDEYFIP